MALSNAERQRRHRERTKDKLSMLEAALECSTTTRPAVPPREMRSKDYPRIGGIVAPERAKKETDEQKAIRWFLFFANGDVDIYHKIMREIGLDKVKDESRIQELLSATRIVIGAWQTIESRLLSKL